MNRKETMILKSGETVPVFSPVIVSASRSTDIPAFYADWFFNRLKEGYSCWKNPFCGNKKYAISYCNTRFIVFWSKNPLNLLNYINDLEERHISCYIQYTLNDYEGEKLEKGVPPLAQRLDTFKRLVDRLGVGRVVWRFDPLILTDKISQDDLLRKIENIGDKLKGYTEKLVFSYADILSYGRVEKNLRKNGIQYIDWTPSMMSDFAQNLSSLNKKWNYTLTTCGEKKDYELYGIKANKCIDDDLIIRFAHNDNVLMGYLGVEIRRIGMDLFDNSIPNGALDLGNGLYALKKYEKAKGQRALCQCIESKDIGEYNTCPHLCEYCYANANKDSAIRNYNVHKQNPYSETITGY
ncbi:DUF1848 domain-containing protein [uncultured Parabacteroides sp.]|uniref:DUF1848 domain-containing protein n=1 Tax=uncultured Parabacteroides sp. TaxID=512312 RepID=UPI002659A847|nr:DUF1848 domain-containing protein [uncultured Parabacteroides sp.]